MNGVLVIAAIRKFNLTAEVLDHMDENSANFAHREYAILDRHSRLLFMKAKAHLQFVADYGPHWVKKTEIVLGDQIHKNYPEYYSAWGLYKLPGLSKFYVLDIYDKYNIADLGDISDLPTP